MKILLFEFFIAALMQILQLAYSKPSYTIVAPGTVCPTRIFNVSITLYDITEPCKIEIILSGPVYKKTKAVVLQANELQVVEFNVSDTLAGEYELQAVGTQGFEFAHTEKLEYYDFLPYALIYFDKSSYRPGDLVKFHAFFLDEYLKPIIPPAETRLVVQDSNFQTVKEFTDLELLSNVHKTMDSQNDDFTTTIQLSENIVTEGHWRFYVCIGNRSSLTADFSIEEKQHQGLAGIKLDIISPLHITLSDDVIDIIALGNYENDEEINGKISLSFEINDDFHDYSIAHMVNGKVKFSLVPQDLRNYLNTQWSKYFSLKFVLKDDLTGSVITEFRTIFVYETHYKANCISESSCNGFHANQQSKVVVQFLDWEERPLTDFSEPLVILKYNIVKELNDDTLVDIKLNYRIFEGHLNESGMVNFDIVLEKLPSWQYYYQIIAEYDGEIYKLPRFKEHVAEETQYEKKENNYFTIKKSENIPEILELNKAYEFTIESSVDLQYFAYNIIGRGCILHSEYIQLPFRTRTYNLTVVPTYLMTPKAYIYIYYIDNYDEFHYAETTFEIKIELQNSLEVLAPEEAEPGTNISLHLKITPNFFIGFWQSAREGSFYIHDIRERLTGFPFWYTFPVKGAITLTNTFGNLPESEFRYLKVPPLKFEHLEHPKQVLTLDKTDDYYRIFDSFKNTNAGTMKMPDKPVAAWFLTAVSLKAEDEIAFTNQVTLIKSSKKLYVDIKLPYSIIKDEIMMLVVSVFNALQDTQTITVTLVNPLKEFTILTTANEVINERIYSQTLSIPGSTKMRARFIIQPKVIGDIKLHFIVSANVRDAQDIEENIYKTLNVLPEGVTINANHAYYLNMHNMTELQRSFELEIPQNIVPESLQTSILIAQDIMAPLIKNLKQFLQTPTACLQQSAANLIVKSLVLQYLKLANVKKPSDVWSQVLRSMEVDHQTLLSASHFSRSFSYYGPVADYATKVKNGSSWLTAYALSALGLAQEDIFINDFLLKEGLRYLASKQTEFGAFEEDEYYKDDQQSKANILTAYVLQAFKANKNLAHNIKALSGKNLEKSYQYLNDQFNKTNDLYEKALIAYTLNNRKHRFDIPKLIETLKQEAKKNDEHTWWSQTKWSQSKEVQTTAYILQILLDMETENLQNILPIVNWLLAQRNSYGAFTTVEATADAMKALVNFQQKFGYKHAVDEIRFGIESLNEHILDKETTTYHIDMIKRGEKLPSKKRTMLLYAKTADANSAALIQIDYTYNTLEILNESVYNITALINRMAPINKLDMKLNIQYRDSGTISSGMSIVEISLPSGYVADYHNLIKIRKVKNVKHADTKISESLIIVHFENLRQHEVLQIHIEVCKRFNIVQHKAATISVYEYERNLEKSVIFYDIATNFCQICYSDETCKKHCK